MPYLLGIDIGTSGLKTAIITSEGVPLGTAYRGYDIHVPYKGYAEQDPETWWKAAVDAIREVHRTSGISPADISAIGLSGQMHTLVALDAKGLVIRPAILWCDQRSTPQIRELHRVMPADRVAAITLNPISPGFTIASLLWLKANEPEHFSRIATVVLPKDYIRYRMTGALATEIVDASGTMCFDAVVLQWSTELLSAVGIDPRIFPDIGRTCAIAGRLTSSAAATIGLRAGTPVAFGGGDQAMQAIGNGIIDPGTASATIGTGGQILTPTLEPLYDRRLRTNTYCNYREGSWTLIGGTLSAGLSLKWLKEKVLRAPSFDVIDEGAALTPPGCGGLVFLPYLIGERAPHMDPAARGVFFGLTLDHDGFAMARAIMEGVAFSLKDSLSIFEELGVRPKRIIASGGGARSGLWKQIQADVFNKEICTTKTIEQACTGAAIAAGVACGVYRDIGEACSRMVALDEVVVEPDPARVERYKELHQIYRELYRNTAALFARL